LGKSRAARGLAVAVRGKVAVTAKHVVPPVRRRPGWRVPDLPRRLPPAPPTATDPKLRNIIAHIWRHAGDEGTVGDGTTFDAVRNEVRTNRKSGDTYHFEKAATLRNGLTNVINNPAVSSVDKATARDLLGQFMAAWKGHR
jgi:hypothetical protein